MPLLTKHSWAELPWLLKWLVMIRAPVLIMTLTAVGAGLLMAAADSAFEPLRAAALLIGLTFAHAINNLLNDLIDSRLGVDHDNYFRTRYGVQVLENKLVEKRSFLLSIVLTALPALSAGGWLIWETGLDTFFLMLTGSVFVVFYTWPMKHWALGEFAVLLVWGPLMTAGTYFVMTGTVTAQMLLLSLLAGIGPTLVILGKHIDKHDDDSARCINTLPVVMGERHARYLSVGLITAHWILLFFCIFQFGDFAALLLILLAAPISWQVGKVFLSPRPAECPAHFPETAWPLWYAAYGFRYAQHWGGLLLLALLARLLLA